MSKQGIRRSIGRAVVDRRNTTASPLAKRRPRRNSAPIEPVRRYDGNGRGEDAVDARVCLLHLITRLDRSGAAENTLLTVTGLDPARYRIVLASGEPSKVRMTPDEARSLSRWLDAARAAGVELVVIPSLGRRIAPLSDLAALLSIMGLIRRLRPQVVHTHTSKAGALGRLAARLCGVPVVVHTPHGHIFYGYHGRLLSACFVAVERWLGRMTDALVALTESGRQDYLERRIAPAARLHAIPSGIDLSAYGRQGSAPTLTRKALGLHARGPVIGVLGQLTPVKGHRYLVEALPEILGKFPSATLLFVGEGPERESLVARAASLGVTNHVRVVGAQFDLPSYIAVCDVIAQPSLNEEMGRTVLEALIMGKPVIASRVGGLPDLIADGRNGLLIPPASPSALAHAVCSLVWDPVRLRRMSGEARRSVGRRFSAQAMVEALDRLYGALLEAERPARAASSVGRRRRAVKPKTAPVRS